MGRRKPKTRAEWKQEMHDRAKRDNYLRIPYDMFYSDAYNSLSKTAKLVLIQSLSELRYGPRSKKKRDEAERNGEAFTCTTLGYLKNNGEFSLPGLWLRVRGINSPATCKRVRQEIVDAGFWVVVRTGSLRRATRFRYSDRWRPDYRGPAAPDLPVGVSLYPNMNIMRRRSDRPVSRTDTHPQEAYDDIQL